MCIRDRGLSRDQTANYGMPALMSGDLISLITADIEALEVFYAHTISPICICLLYTSRCV